MPGRPQFETVVAQAPRKYLTNIYQQKTGNIAASQTEMVYMYAPSGFVGRIVNLYFTVLNPTSATGGNHDITLALTSGANVLYGASSPTKSLVFDDSCFYMADITTVPADAAAITYASKNVFFDSAIGLQFIYRNNTDKDQANARTYNVCAIMEQVAS